MRRRGKLHIRGVFKRPGSRYWWCSYVDSHGELTRESTKCLTKKDAEEFRAARLVARGNGQLVKGAKDVTLQDLRKLAEDRYVGDGNRPSGLRRLKLAWNVLEAGLPVRALDITDATVAAYERARREAGRALSTINYEKSCLRHAWRLATKGNSPLLPLGRMPTIETPTPQNARQGIVTREQLTAILAKLPEWARPVVLFLAITGWRVSEAIGLIWANVDSRRKLLRLEATDTKAGTARTFPYGPLPALDKLLSDRGAPAAPVFTKDGAPIPYKALRKAWRAACRAAKQPGKLMHDLRRTAASSLIEIGIDEGTIMELCGWETRAMFDRYHIVSEHAKEAAVAKLAAALEPPPPQTKSQAPDSKFVIVDRIRRTA